MKTNKIFAAIAGITLLCFMSGFFGSWVAIQTGLLGTPVNQSLTEKRTVVSNESDVVADIAKKLSPSVVSIIVETQASFGFSTYTQQGAGTGIIISKDGYVLTNKHVVSGAKSVKIVDYDGKEYKNVKVIGTDPANDIAFLKIADVDNLPVAELGDSSSVEVGDKVIAIGNALGQYQTTVTSGIISGIGRPIVAGDRGSSSSESLTNLLQTDAAINPGNSGGPLVDLNGKVIGINTAIDQNAEGIGFAIPIDDARGVINSVTSTGKIERAFLGVSYVMITPDVKQFYKLDRDDGAYIINDNGSAVASGSPAAKAGLQEGDIITKFDGTTVDDKHPLLSLISQHSVGDSVQVEYVRDGKTSTATVTLAAYPNS